MCAGLSSRASENGLNTVTHLSPIKVAECGLHISGHLEGSESSSPIPTNPKQFVRDALPDALANDCKPLKYLEPRVQMFPYQEPHGMDSIRVNSSNQKPSVAFISPDTSENGPESRRPIFHTPEALCEIDPSKPKGK